MPWGLIFDPRVVLPSEPSDRDFQAGFWCTRRRLATVFQNEGGYLPTPENQGNLISVICPKALKDSGGRTDDWPPEGVYFIWSKLVDSQADERRDRRDRVLYLFCHGANDCLEIDTGDGLVRITSDEFSLYVNKRPENVLEILVFNACGSKFAASGSWLNHVWRRGLRGFIGGEAKIPTAFAWDFGRDLVRTLLSDKVPCESVSEVLHGLRLKHWPLGLLYGLYADPGVSFRGRINTDYIPEIEKNWCDSLGGRV